MVYRIVEGKHDEEDNSYFCGEEMSPKTDFPTKENAETNFKFECFMKHFEVRRIEGGLFAHIPGVESVYSDDRYERIWLIRRIDNLAVLG